MHSLISLSSCNLGPEAGKRIGDALKTNTTLTNLQYVQFLSVSHFVFALLCSFGCFEAGYSCIRLHYNALGPEAGKAVLNALRTNTTLTTLQYV